MNDSGKVTSLEDAIRSIHDGDQVAIGGHSQRRHPMGLLYEIVRRRTRNLRLLGWNNGIDMDLLIGAGCVSEIQTSYVGMGKYGLAQNFRRAAERGEIDIIEDSEITALDRFRAGSMGIPFMPSPTPVGSDLMQFERQTLEISCPFSGRKVAALRAARPDVALIHAHTADARGNVQLDERYLMENIADVDIARCAQRVIVSVEQIVSTEAIMQHPERTILPGLSVDAVVELSYGAHPCACDTRYDWDDAFTEHYCAASRDTEAFRSFLDEFVYSAESHSAYIDKTEFLNKVSDR